MTELIIPVKPLSVAKQRLAVTLTPSQRAALVLAMLQDLLAVVSRLPGLTSWVVSNDNDVLDLARYFACREIQEPVVAGYNAAVLSGLQAVKSEQGNHINVAFMPADIPFASPADLLKLTHAAATDTATVRLAPSHDQRGTNGVFMSSANLLKPSFGENSFHRYRHLSLQAGIVPEVLTGSTLAQDIDTPVDLALLRNCEDRNAQGMHGAHGVHEAHGSYGVHDVVGADGTVGAMGATGVACATGAVVRFIRSLSQGNVKHVNQ